MIVNVVSASGHTKRASLTNQKCKIRLTVVYLHPNEYSQELHYYSFAVKLDRCVGSCDTPDDVSNKVFVSNKTEDWNLSVFNMITGIDELKILNPYDRICNSNQK